MSAFRPAPAALLILTLVSLGTFSCRPQTHEPVAQDKSQPDAPIELPPLQAVDVQTLGVAPTDGLPVSLSPPAVQVQPAVVPTPLPPPAPQLQPLPTLGWLMIAGERVPVATRVVLWNETGGFDGHTPGPDGPRSSERVIVDSALAAEVAAHGWTHERLGRQVDQFVLHFDGCCTSRQCASVLEERGLSVHFLLDVDGTIHQSLDLTARAWHATIANDRSVGIEIANPGAHPEERASDILGRYYPIAADGWPMLSPPNGPDPSWPIEFVARPARSGLIHGPIHAEPLAQYDYTPEQYESLARLLAALHRALPKIRMEVPREADGAPMTRQLNEKEFAEFHGMLGHYHVQRNKVDPGPALQWDWVLKRAAEVDRLMVDP